MDSVFGGAETTGLYFNEGKKGVRVAVKEGKSDKHTLNRLQMRVWGDVFYTSTVLQGTASSI